MAIITISRTLGSGGDQIALDLCRELGYQLFDKNLVVNAARDAGITDQEITDLSEDTYQTRGFFERLFGRNPMIPYMGIWPDDLAAMYALEKQALNEEDLLHFIQKAVRWAYQAGDMIIVGRGGQILLKDHPDVLHVRLDAPIETRIQRVLELLRQNEPEQKLDVRARELIVQRDTASAEYIKRFYHVNWADPLLYHLVFNTKKVGSRQIIDLIIHMVSQLPSREKSPAQVEANKPG